MNENEIRAKITQVESILRDVIKSIRNSLYVKDEKQLYNTISDQMKALEKQNELLLSEIFSLKKIVDLMEEKNKKKGPGKRAKK